MRTHVLKTLPRYWQALADGTKTFEVRKDDRAFAEGDTLVLRRYDPTDTYAHGGVKWCGGVVDGRNGNNTAYHVRPSNTCSRAHDDIVVTVTYVLPGGKFGIDPGWVVLGLGEKEQP